MRGIALLMVLVAVSACGSAAPSTREESSVAEPPMVECGALVATLCHSIAEAAELMTGTAPRSVVTLPVPSDDGAPIEERYVVTLEPGAGAVEPHLVEVVRLEGSENWSVRRLDKMPAD